MAFLAELQTPTNFGLQYFEDECHGNISLILKDGKCVKANSMVLSINSTVFAKLISERHQTTIELDDFAPDAARSFIRALYCGHMGQIVRSLFRDVNKLARVFKVAWLTKHCNTYLEGMIHRLGQDTEEYDYDTTMEVFRDVQFEETQTPLYFNTGFMGIFRAHLERIGWKKNFLKQYMVNVANLSRRELELMIALAGQDVKLIVEVLQDHIDKCEGALDLNARFLLQNINFSICLQQDYALHDTFFTKLNENDKLSMEDMKMVFSVHRKSAKKDFVNLLAMSDQMRIPNLFDDNFSEFSGLSHDEYKFSIAWSPNIRSLYMYLESFLLWIKSKNKIWPKLKVDALFNIEEIVKVKKLRGWGTVALEYVDWWEPQIKACNDQVTILPMAQIFFDALRQNEELCSEGISVHSDGIIDIGSTFMITAGITKKYVMFTLARIQGCNLVGQCGVVLEITPVATENDVSDIRLCGNLDKHCGDMHFHEEMLSVNNMHLSAVNISPNSLNNEIRLSWRGRPGFPRTDPEERREGVAMVHHRPRQIRNRGRASWGDIVGNLRFKLYFVFENV